MSPSFFCWNKLKQVSLSLDLYAGDNSGRYPGEVPISASLPEDSCAELLVSCFQRISNELSDVRVLLCPADKRGKAPNFGSLRITNISYFLSIDDKNGFSNTIAAGDRNLQMSGERVKPRLFALSANPRLSWTDEMHSNSKRDPRGNLLFQKNGLGSVLESTTNLNELVKQQDVLTNRLLVP